eukprot:1408612-Amphidinium_carterae.2
MCLGTWVAGGAVRTTLPFLTCYNVGGKGSYTPPEGMTPLLATSDSNIAVDNIASGPFKKQRSVIDLSLTRDPLLPNQPFVPRCQIVPETDMLCNFISLWNKFPTLGTKVCIVLTVKTSQAARHHLNQEMRATAMRRSKMP